MQMQEDEIQLLKMALADVLKRLNISEEQQAAAASATVGRRGLGAKGGGATLMLAFIFVGIDESDVALDCDSEEGTDFSV